MVNYWAILVAAIAMMIVGWLWFGVLFRSAWSKGMGMDHMDPAKMEQMKKTMGWSYFQQFVAALITAAVLAILVNLFALKYPGSAGLHLGLMAGFWPWLGFYLPVKWGDMLWGGKSSSVTWIELSNSLVSLLVAGIIIGAWR
jgi:hypothetical protein